MEIFNIAIIDISTTIVFNIITCSNVSSFIV